MRHNCVKESYWRKIFEENESVKLMNKLTGEDESFSNLAEIDTTLQH